MGELRTYVPTLSGRACGQSKMRLFISKYNHKLYQVAFAIGRFDPVRAGQNLPNQVNGMTTGVPSRLKGHGIRLPYSGELFLGAAL